MATQTIRAFATVADVSDGTAGVSIILSNENHTFVADTDGAVASTDLSAFNCDIDVLVGTTVYAFIASGNLAAGQWKISDGTDDGASAITVAGGLTPSVTDQGDDARITIADDTGSTGGFADGGSSSPDAVQMVVPIQVRIGSVTRSFSRIVSLSKAKGGSAKLLTLTVDANTLIYDKDNALKNPTENITFEAELVNIASTAGNVDWEYRIVPTAAWTAFPNTSGIVRSLSQDRRLAVTRQALANLLTGGAQYIAVRAMVDSVFDIGSVHRIQDGADGDDGAAAVEARLIPRSSTVLLNNAGTVIYDAKLFYKGVAADDAISAYQWFTRTNNIDTNIAGATSSFESFAAMTSGSGSRLVGCAISYDDTHADVTG